jgi:hypothetical protein
MLWIFPLLNGLNDEYERNKEGKFTLDVYIYIYIYIHLSVCFYLGGYYFFLVTVDYL